MFAGRFALVTSILLSFSTVPAFADDSGWVSGYKAFNQFLMKRNKNFFPTKIECRDSNKADFTEGNAEFRVTYIETDDVRFYRWGVGGGFGEAKAIAAREGLKLISSDQFTRAKSGLVVRCGIWARN
jgi:hypothetical protein